MQRLLPSLVGSAVVLAVSSATAPAATGTAATAPTAAPMAAPMADRRPAHRGALPDVGLIATPTMPTLAARQIAVGTEIVNLLATHGVADRHFVIDTVDNGRGFDGGWFHQRLGSSAILARAPLCRTRQQSRCVTVGLPPTTDVTEAAAGLSSTSSGQAAQHVDGHLWISRPWLTRPGQVWSPARALQLVRTSPFL